MLGELVVVLVSLGQTDRSILLPVATVVASPIYRGPGCDAPDSIVH